MIDGGYFPKRIAATPDGLELPGVQEICSVSHCISPAPDEWIDRWLHNEWGWYNTLADAQRVIPAGHEGDFRLFAYRLHHEVFTAAGRVPLPVPDDVRPEPMGAEFQRLGFDSANRSMPTVLGFECSPLTCNRMAREMEANAHGLFPTLESAIAGADRFAAEQPEPGEYFVIEVLERQPNVVESREERA